MLRAARDRSRAIRVLRVLLACAVVWLSSGLPKAGPVWTDGIVLVADSPGEESVDGADARAARAPSASCKALPSWSAVRRDPSATKPTNTTENTRSHPRSLSLQSRPSLLSRTTKTLIIFVVSTARSESHVAKVSSRAFHRVRGHGPSSASPSAAASTRDSSRSIRVHSPLMRTRGLFRIANPR